MKTLFLVFFALFLFGCEKEKTEQGPSSLEGTWIDLTYAFDENTVYWPTAGLFQLDTVFEGTTDQGYYYSAYKVCAAEHGGTHLDAPAHFARGGHSVEEIPLEKLIGKAIVIDVSAKALVNRDHQINIADIRIWEEEHGEIPPNTILLFRTGYGKFWPDRLKIHGYGQAGPRSSS